MCVGPHGGQVAQMKICLRHFHQTPSPTPGPESSHSRASVESVPVMLAPTSQEFQQGLGDFIFLKTESLIFKHNDHFKHNNHYNNNLLYLHSAL